MFNRIALSKKPATLKFWLSPGIDLRHTKTVQTATDNSERRNSKGYLANAQLQVGISYFLSEKFRLTAAWQGLSYTYSISKREGMEGVSYGHNFDIRLNPAAIRFGVEMRL